MGEEDDAGVGEEEVSGSPAVEDSGGGVGDEEDEVDYEDGPVDEELEEMKRKVQEMENEAAKLKALQKDMTTEENKDEQSIYVGQVDYDATPEELQTHFASCGTINRVTILCDKFSGKSKGYAYVEFEDKESVENAVKLDNTIFKGRQLKVSAKRTNLPGRGGGMGRGARGGRRGGRGRGFRGGRGGFYRGRGRGGYGRPY